MGLDEDTIEGALRLGLGKFSSDADIEQAASCLAGAVAAIRDLMAV